MKKLYSLFVLAATAWLVVACEDEFQQPDTRLLGKEVVFKAVDPVSGEVKPNVFQGAFRAENNLEVRIETDYRINRVEVVSLNEKKVISTLAVNGLKANFSYPVADLNVPFGQAVSLLFHVYFDDAGADGLSYPSLKTFPFRVVDDVPSPVVFRHRNGSTQEIKAETVNARSVQPSEKGIVTSFKGGENSFIRLENSPLLKFGANRDFSFSFWVKSTHNISDPAMIGTMNWNSSDNTGWVLAWRRGQLRLVATSREEGKKADIRNNEADFDVRYEASPWLDGEYHFVTCTFAREGDMVIYVDGVPTASAPLSAFNIGTDAAVHINQDGTGTYGDKLDATYVKIVFYDYALTAAEVLAEFNQ